MADQLTSDIIGAAIEVHRHLGPGLLESIYEAALCHELGIRSIKFEKQKHVDILYKGLAIKGQRLDLVVEDEVILELKAVDHLNPIHFSQTLSYLKATGRKKALIINFNTCKLIDGIKRVVL